MFITAIITAAVQVFSFVTVNGMPATWDKCEITWSTTSHSKMIRNSLDQIEDVTGFTFKRVPRDGDIEYRWVREIPRHPDLAGYFTAYWSKTEGAPTVGKVFVWVDSSFSRQNQQNVTLHETLHALGLDHVDNAASVMNPVTSTIVVLDQGSIAGLQELSRLNGCNA